MTPTPQPSKEEMSQHAIVKTKGYDIPLIGVSPDSTFERCETCKKQIHIQEIKMDESGKGVCSECRISSLQSRIAELEEENGKLQGAIDLALDIGVYVKAQTEKQEGWNEAVSKIIERFETALTPQPTCDEKKGEG